MASSTLAFLLHLPPDQAIVRMLNDANGTNYRLDRFTVSAPRVVAGTTTTVTLTSTDISPYLDDQVTVGSIDFTYERLQLALFLKGVLDNFTPSLPCSTQNLLNEITHRLDQRFYGDDILLEELTRTNGVQYVLNAKPESLRFVGSITLPLIQVTDIATLFDPDLISGEDDPVPVYPNLDDAVAYITGTDLLNSNSSISSGTQVLANSAILQVIQQQVPDPVTGQYHASWYCDNSASGPYNLYGSVVVYRGRIQSAASSFTYSNPSSGAVMRYWFPELCNTAIPTLDEVVVIALHSGYCSNFKGTLTVPYSSAKFDYTPAQLAADKAANPTAPNDSFNIPGDGFVAKPRLLHNSVVSISNGTAWNAYLNTLRPQTLLTFQTTPPVLMDGPNAWVATFGSLVYTNLYNANIVYNGQVRAEDLPSATVGLDRVMVVDFTPSSNSQWTGQYPFYYQSPVEISGTSFSSTLGSLVRIPLLATGAGVSVVEVKSDGTALGTTAIPAGLTLTTNNGSWVISGTPTTEGSFTYYLNVTSGTNTVFYSIYHLVRKVISTLTLAGTLTPATQGDVTWQSYLDILGGQAPYTLGTITGDLPSSITAVIQDSSVHLTGTWNDNALHHFNIAITSADGQSTSASYAFQASGTALYVTASASLSALQYINIPFNGNYTVVGGQAPYTYTTTSGTFPPGMLLNGGTGSVTGTPTAGGTYTWTVTVSSSDGFSGTCTVTMTVSTATYQSQVLADTPASYWPCNETSGLVLADITSNAYNSTVTADPNIIVGGPPLRPGSTGSLQTKAQFATVTSGFYANELYSSTTWAMECISLLSATTVGQSLFTGGGVSGTFYQMGIFGITNWQATSDGELSVPANNVISTIPSTTATHLVLERNGPVLNFYVNGILRGSTTPVTWNPVAIMQALQSPAPSSPGLGVIGQISDIAVYGYALGATKALLHAKLAGLYTGS